MKYLIIITIILLSSCSSEPEDKELRNCEVHLLKYIHDEYVKASEEELVALDKKMKHLKEKNWTAKSKIIKSKYTTEIVRIEKKIETLRLWPLYYKVLIIKSAANETKVMKAEKMISKIKLRYKELNGHEFPDVEQEFRAKYLVEK